MARICALTEFLRLAAPLRQTPLGPQIESFNRFPQSEPGQLNIEGFQRPTVAILSKREAELKPAGRKRARATSEVAILSKREAELGSDIKFN